MSPQKPERYAERSKAVPNLQKLERLQTLIARKPSIHVPFHWNAYMRNGRNEGPYRSIFFIYIGGLERSGSGGFAMSAEAGAYWENHE